MTRHASGADPVFGRRAEACGILIAGANVPLTLQRTLMSRGLSDQAIVTGLSLSTNEAIVSLLQDSVQTAARLITRRRGLDDVAAGRVAVVLDGALCAAGLAAQAALAPKDREPLARAGARTVAFWMALTGGAGATLGTVDELLRDEDGRHQRRTIPTLIAATGALAGAAEWQRRRRARLDANLPPEDAAAPLRAIAFGAAVALGTAALGSIERRSARAIGRVLATTLPGDETLWQPIGHAVALGAVAAAGRALVQRAFGSIEAREGAVETAFDVAPPSPMVSGSYDSVVPFATMSVQGRRFVWMSTPHDVIEEVTGTPAVAQPIRVYVGLASAPTERERVELALRDLDRTGAFERAWLMLVSPTGTGYVNYAAASALELLSAGDCAIVAMQYAARPSVLSLARVDDGREQMRLLVDGIRERLAARPEDKRPKVVLFGESLGAWTSQDPFVDRGTQGLIEAGIDHAIWIGTPHFSKWKDQVVSGDRNDVDDAAVKVFDRIEEWRALEPQARARVRYVMVTHHDDGVALFGPELAVQAPAWLGDAEGRPDRVPRGMRWVPTTTFFQVLTDMKNSANVVPGVFAAKGHDYRADLLPFFDAVLHFDTPPDRLAAMHAWLEERERIRTEWLQTHNDAGRSLSVAVLERLMEQERAAGHDPDAALLRVIREVANEERAARTPST
jgi:uncharacterized membrane protein